MKHDRLFVLTLGTVHLPLNTTLTLQVTTPKATHYSLPQLSNRPPDSPLAVVLEEHQSWALKVVVEGLVVGEREVPWRQGEERVGLWGGVGLVEVGVAVHRLQAGLLCQHLYWQLLCSYLQHPTPTPAPAPAPTPTVRPADDYHRLQQELLSTLSELSQLQARQLEPCPKECSSTASTSEECGTCRDLEEMYERRLWECRRELALAREGYESEVRALEDRVEREREKARESAKSMQAHF
jgi:hypothetical protein